MFARWMMTWWLASYKAGGEVVKILTLAPEMVPPQTIQKFSGSRDFGLCRAHPRQL